MAFSTVQFLFVFLPLCLAVYYLLPRRLRPLVLAGFTAVFFAWAGVRATLLLLVFAAANWLWGLLLQRRPHKALLALGVVGDVALLLLYKYAAFFATSVNAALPGALPVIQLALPLGLSFYVFTAIGYLVDVYAGRCQALRSPVRFFVFLCFFGHGPSGPIVRCGQQAPQLAALCEKGRTTPALFCYGIKRFCYGLAKKAIIADQLALIYGKVTAVPAATLPAPLLLLGYAAFMLQLYYDFSGYSDMAIGIGAFFGLDLPENFDYPYLSRSISEYWRRWHMTLTGWFRDFVYIPLGGSRRGTARTSLNLLVVFTLTGLWHGAAWQYVVFGLVHGTLCCIERLFLRKALDRLPLLGHLYTITALLLSLTIFGAPGLGEGLAALQGILTWQTGVAGYTLAAFADTKLLAILAVAVLLCGPLQALCPKWREDLRSKEPFGLPTMAVLFALLFFGIMRVTAGTYSAFIYFQF